MVLVPVVDARYITGIMCSKNAWAPVGAEVFGRGGSNIHPTQGQHKLPI